VSEGRPPRPPRVARNRDGGPAARGDRGPSRSPAATREHHPARVSRARSRGGVPGPPRVEIPRDLDEVELRLGDRAVRLTNLRKPFWPDLGLSKGDLLQYYADVSSALLPHVRDRAMVMKRYPHGAAGEFFFMKRAPSPRPEWIELCAIEHASGNVIDFPMVQDLLSLLWVVNLGCIDLNQWYARCDDVDRPDWLHFDLDPVKGPEEPAFARVREAALVVREALGRLGIPCWAKTSGSRGVHVYVPIERGPTQKEVWSFAKAFAVSLAGMRPDLLTSEYRVGRRPQGRVLVDYNQNAWGRTLASVYSVRPTPLATVSTPVDWTEIEQGVDIAAFHLRNVPARVRERGDLWAPLLETEGRFRLQTVMPDAGRTVGPVREQRQMNRGG
jgi:bifunctional non-homologous end joining protein LigD